MKLRNSLVVGLLCCMLLAFASVCCYAFPFADDFCFGWTAAERIPFLQKFLNQYLYWNGRYTSDILVQFHPLLTGKIWIYQLSLLAGVLLMPLAIYFFLRELLEENLHCLIASLFITVFYFNYMPDVTEELYWFIGSVNYHWAHILILAQFTFFLKSIRANGKLTAVYQFCSLLLIIISVGFNETGAVIIASFYSLLFLWSSFKRNKFAKPFGYHALFALVSFAFVFASPGNFIRAENFPDKHQLFYSFGYSVLQTARFTSLWMCTLPFVVLTVLIPINADKIKWRFNLNLDYRWLGFGALLVVFIGSFLPYYATGLLGQHRTINFVFLFFIFLYLLFLFAISKRFLILEKWRNWFSSNKQFTLILLCIFSMLFSGNCFKIIRDFKEGYFALYRTAFYQRQKAILKNKEAVIVPFEKNPKTFKITDVKGEPTYWTDKCMGNFYRETGIELK